MPQYRNVPAEEMAASLKSAVTFAADLNTGPATQALLTDWIREKRWKTLQNAETDSDLLKAVNATHPDRVFIRLQDLFRFHAALNTEGKGRQIYRDIVRWGTPRFMWPAECAQTQEEVRQHISRSLRNPLTAIKYAADTCFSAAGYGTKGILRAHSPFKKYGMVIPDQDEEKYDWMAKAKEVLASNIDRDEIYFIGLGWLTEPNDKRPLQGIELRATRDAMEALASVFPEYEILDITEKGKTIRPPHRGTPAAEAHCKV